jgi:hypothetical protein
VSLFLYINRERKKVGRKKKGINYKKQIENGCMNMETVE